MATSKNAKIQIETSQVLTTYTAMTDSGDNQIFTAGTLWSGKSGFEPDVRPNGIVTGRNILSVDDAGVNDTVDIAAFTAYSMGTLQTVSATETTITRTATASKAQIHSITMASDGSIAVVEGTLSADTTFSETRGAAGGPPLIPVNSVELGQIRVTASTAAAITSSEIFQVVDTHTERYDFPTWTISNSGKGDKAVSAAEEDAHVKFDSALDQIHTGGVSKGVFIKYYTPGFSSLAKAIDFVPADNSHSVTSEEFYGAGAGSTGTIASTTSSLGQASFTAMLTDGIQDALVQNRDQIITVKFFPDADKAPYILTQGTLGIERSFPTGAQNKAACTVSAETESVNFTS